MRKLFFITLLIISSYITAQNPQTIFEENLKVIQNYQDGKMIPGYGLSNAINFLEELTGIKSHIEEGFDNLIDPTEDNLRSWRKWFEENKLKLVWSKTEKKIIVKNPKNGN